MPANLLTIDEAAKLLSVSRSTVTRLIQSRALASIKIGKGRRSPRRVDADDLNRFIDRNRVARH